MNRFTKSTLRLAHPDLATRLLALSARTAIVALAAALSLTACGGGSPSETDVKAALLKQVDASQEQAHRMVGKNAFFDSQADEQRKGVNAIKLIGCHSSGEKAWLCDVEAKAGALQIRMLQGSDGSIATEGDKG